MSALTDARGCLTPAGVRAVAEAPPGRGPEELVRHLAGCVRCQNRLLAVDEPAGRRSRSRSLRLAVIGGVGLFALLLGLLLASLVRGG